MPIATGAIAPELPTPCIQGLTGMPGMPGPDASNLLRKSSTEQIAECLSPGATPKVSIPSFVANGPNVPHWTQSPDPMPQMMYTTSAEPYGCPPAGLMLVPFPCMMDQNGHLIQFPCAMDQSQPLSWAPPSIPGNGFHMPYSQTCQEEINLVTPRTGASEKTSQDVAEDADEFTADPALDCIPDDILALGNPQQILVNGELASTVEALLENSSRPKCAAIINWMLPAVIELALSANGTRIIQKALEVSGSDSQIRLSQCLHGYARRLLDSHHGNHVLQKSIVMMPPHAVQFIFHELPYFRGGWAGVACHRFGCRVVERLLEHCQAELTAPIVAAVVAEIDSLSRHPFANYVVQHILEHVPAHRPQVVQALIEVGVPLLAQHRVASNVVERAFEHSGVENQRILAEAILSTPMAIVDMGCSRYGNFTVRRMLEALQDPLYYVAIQQLAEAVPRLRASKHGRHLAARVSAALSK